MVRDSYFRVCLDIAGGLQTGPGETLEMCLALSDKAIVWDQGADGGLTEKGHKELLAVMETFSVLTEVVVMWVCIFVKIYCTVHFKQVYFIVSYTSIKLCRNTRVTRLYIYTHIYISTDSMWV